MSLVANLIDLQNPQLPDHFPVAVIMERIPVTGSLWIDHRWQAAGVVVDGQPEEAVRPAGDGAAQRVLHHGFRVRLFVDECESYYHNLVSPTPRCYVIASLDEAQTPVPRRISLSFDEAHAYLEGEDELYSVEMPPELYRWMEAFVLAHYVPRKRTKRKLRDWRGKGGDSQ